MKKKFKVILILFFILIVSLAISLLFVNNGETLKTVKSEKQLLSIYGETGNSSFDSTDIKRIALTSVLGPSPAFMIAIFNQASSVMDTNAMDATSMDESSINSLDTDSSSTSSGFVPESSSIEDSTSSKPKDYSTTNIQVENVDEADITKTDGDYIYSISEYKVVITNVIDPSSVHIESTIDLSNSFIPVDLMLYNNKLAIIGENTSNQKYTSVEIYDISSKDNPEKMKSFELHQPYYTSRCINNMFYIISSGYYVVNDDNIERDYKEDNEQKEIPLSNYKYLKNLQTSRQTLLASVDLNNLDDDIKISAYAMDVSNAYVSKNSIYLLDDSYNSSNDSFKYIKKLFGLKGIFGLFDDDFYYSSSRQTDIYKFDILNNGQISYNSKADVDGTTINQYSLDEKDGHLRIATYDSDGTRVTIFNEKLEKLGQTENMARGENMYSSRFVDDKVYLVTYKNMDPLFVVDLSNEYNPTVLGELKIPGYSTYLHPYDENHIIGIGMETEEVLNKNSSGRVTSSSSKIIGMKMALFDVSDVNNPVQISQTIIGDRRTTSAILTNPKALLFSKEKELIAIPVNNYDKDFETSETSNYNSDMINTYKSYSSSYVAEGYFVYNINLNDGFTLKGTILHDNPKKRSSSYYNYNASKMLRGLYIDNNLYTISENALKVNDLNTLELVSELNINNEIYSSKKSK